MTLLNNIKQYIRYHFSKRNEEKANLIPFNPSYTSYFPIVEHPFMNYWGQLNKKSILESLQYKDNYLSDVNKIEDRAISLTTYQQKLNMMMSLENMTKDNKLEILENIFEDCRFIYQILKPLTNLGIHFSLDLVGGAVRDFLLDQQKNIKDLDILILFPDHYSLPELLTIDYSSIFSIEELKKIDFYSSEDKFSLKAKLVQLCLQKFSPVSDDSFILNNKERILFENTDSYGHLHTIDHPLIALFKIASPSLHYPMELLVTKLSRSDYIRSMDFDICKTGICLVDYHNRNQNPSIYFPDYFGEIYSRIYHSSTFWADIINQKITFNADNKSEDIIEHSFSSHYQRIKQKYPDYTPLIIGEKAPHYNFAQIALLKASLDLTLPVKNTNKRSKL